MMEPRDYIEQVDRCENKQELGAWIDEVLEAFQCPPVSRVDFCTASMREQVYRDVHRRVAQVATRLWACDPTGEEPPHAETPFEAILAIRRWCAKRKPKSTTEWAVPWDSNDSAYIGSREAREKFSNGKPNEAKLSKLLGTIPVHFMREHGKGSRVHIGDYRRWAAKTYPLNSAEIADEYIAHIEARKAEARTRKPRA